jgi:hypothetical protein
VSERPILFSGAMVRAILARTKTQTRRIIKLPKGAELDGITKNECPPIEVFCSRPNQPTGAIRFGCPYGAPGDRLWVRETWAIPDDLGPASDVAYRADMPPDAESDERWARRVMQPAARWRPSIHMPRAFSRITLEITDVRVERLQSISDDDALAEGIRFDGKWFDGGPHPIKGTPKAMPSAVSAFESLWDSINAKRAAWSSNPWVWVVAFHLADGLGGCDTCDVQTPAKAGT